MYVGETQPIFGSLFRFFGTSKRAAASHWSLSNHLNLLLQFIPQAGWLEQSNFFLHLGIILAIVGFMLGMDIVEPFLAG